ncbi:MAG: tetratricopeptide repeat protein [Bacteroidales bacterium]|nr:tetratricopeptide repeat protein [Bacteroidales bacterium]
MYTVVAENNRLIELLEALDNTSMDTNRVNLLMDISNEFFKTEPKKASEYCYLAWELSNELGNKAQQLDALLLCSNIHFILFENDSAQYFINKAREIAEKDDIYYSGRINNLESNILIKRGDYERALGLLSQSSRFFKQLKDDKGLADTYNKVGVIYTFMAVYDSAVYYYIEANKKYRLQMDSLGIVKTLINTGKCFANLDDNQKAMDYFQQAKRIVLYKKDPKLEGNVYNNLGMIFSRLTQYDSAIHYFDKAINIFDKMGSLTEFGGNVFINKACIYDAQEQYDKAFEDYNTALSLFNKTNDISGIVVSKLNIAVIYARWENYNKTLEIYDSCLVVAREYQLLDYVLDIYYNIFVTYQALGNYEKAFECQSYFINLKDSIYNIQRAETISDLELKYETEKNKAKILKKDIELKKKKFERNLVYAISSGVLLIFVLLFLNSQQKVRKDKIIKEKEIARLKEETKALAAKALVEGQEEERKRVAQELHDGLGVLLSTVKLQFTNFIDKNPENTVLLEKATNVLDRASSDVRRISHNMMPGILTKLGLIEAIEDLFDEVNFMENINAELLVNGGEERLPENVEIMIYRVIQEMVNNTLKHASATQISLVLTLHPKDVHIQFSDNGKGFNVKETAMRHTLGLQSIESRVLFFDGEINIESSEGKGTSFMIYLPV